MLREAAFTPVRPGQPEDGEWVSEWAEPEEFVDLVASWNLALRDDVSVEVGVQVRVDGKASAWYSLGRWSFTGPRSSAGQQEDEHGRVDVDVLRLTRPAQAFRLRFAGLPADEQDAVRLAGAAVSSGPAELTQLERGTHAVRPLAVPARSQQVHRGTHEALGGGGASWCSPTCTAMVLAYRRAGPTAIEIASVAHGSPQPDVVHAAIHTYDTAYGGCGNWSFNVAYAGRYGVAAYVARLGSLAEAAAYVRGGTPLVLSIACGSGELDGAPYADGTTGHLLVLVGFTAAGDPIVNEPAAIPVTAVRRSYPRCQLERAWLSGSGGFAYVIRPPDRSPPP